MKCFICNKEIKQLTKDTIAACVMWGRVCNMTQKELALKSGCSRQTISKIEKGILRPSDALINKIEIALGITQVDTLQWVNSNLISSNLIEANEGVKNDAIQEP